MTPVFVGLAPWNSWCYQVLLVSLPQEVGSCGHVRKAQENEGFPTTSGSGRLWSAWDAKVVGWGGLLLRSVFLYLTMNLCVTLGDVASICFLGGAGSRKNQNKKPDLNHDQEGSFNPGSWLHGFQNLFSKQNWCWHSSRPNKMRV